MSHRTKNHRSIRSLILILALIVTSDLCAEEAKPDVPPEPEPKLGFAAALKGGKVHLGLRYRFETVDEDRFADSAEASTLRTTLSYRTAEWKRWSLFLEAENVAAIFNDDGFNNAGAGDAGNGVRGVPVIADPALTEINQASLSWHGERATLTLGRQEINLGDQRFVGAVGWRQNHQSFDAVRLQADLSSAVAIDYTFVSKALRIFGDDIDMASHFLNLPVQVAPDHRLAAYGYLLDYDDLTTLSTTTFGLEYSAKFALSGGFDLRLELDAAQQEDTADNPLPIDTDYFMASVGGDVGKLGFDVTWEVLGDRDGGARAFQTPLATLHKWNGWADKFLQTPSAGLETLYLRFKGKLNERWRFMLIYHDFTSDAGSFDYGTEIDGELVFKAPWEQTLALKVAVYDADDFSTDTEKVMFWSSYSF